MTLSPRSERYDDIYFGSNGLNEKRFVFLRGTRAESRWVGRRRFLVGELGFGTGLSALATWAAARRHPGFVQFVSIEAHPLARERIETALEPFSEIASERQRFLQLYPERPPGPGVHHFDLADNFALTLWIGDAESVLGQIDGRFDAWYLDGFSPAKNPRMWKASVFAEIARLSTRGATVASYTAAGSVRRGLTDAGFAVERLPGFGNKRHRIEAVYQHGSSATEFSASIEISGAGIAGLSLARSLRRRGVEVRLWDPDPRRGASANPFAMVSPRINRTDDPQSRFQVRAFEYAARLYREDAAFLACGVLRLAVDGELDDRFAKAIDSGTLGFGASRMVSAERSSALTGVKLSHRGLWMPEGGVLVPQKLWLRLRSKLEICASRLPTDSGDTSRWIAHGPWATPDLAGLPMRISRGQLSVCRSSGAAQRLRCVVSAHGYISPAVDGCHGVGASYKRAELSRSAEVARDGDDRDNIARVAAWSPQLAAGLEVLESRAALRALVPDHMPLIGHWGPRVVLGALGSRGFALAPLGAEVIVSTVLGMCPPLERAGRAAVSPERFRSRTVAGSASATSLLDAP